MISITTGGGGSAPAPAAAADDEGALAASAALRYGADVCTSHNDTHATGVSGYHLLLQSLEQQHHLELRHELLRELHILEHAFQLGRERVAAL